MDQRLTLASARLARAAPELWREFMSAMSAHTGTQVQNLVSSPPDHLLQLQGRAQSMTALLDLLSRCVQDADRIEEKARK